MTDLADCLIRSHDPALVAGAVTACGLTALVTFALFAKSRSADAAFRPAYLGLMATVASVGTWTTHIIAMLAYRTVVPVTYHWAPTVLSLALTVPVLGGGLVLSATARRPAIRILGGAIAGLGIGTMHYTGIAAMVLPGTSAHQAWGIPSSIALGVALCALATAAAGRGGRAGVVLPTLAFALGVASLHFTGMASLGIAHDPAVAYDGAGLTTGELSAAATAASFALLLLAALAARVERAASGVGERRVRELAEAALEGIAFSRDGLIEDANAAFCALAGADVTALRGTPVSALFADASAPGRGTVETDLRARDGTAIPVSLHARQSAGASGRVVHVVRDLRQQREAEARIRHLALHDGLTGLANRARFNEALAAALADRRDGAPGPTLLALDLDRFKWVNDTLGHGVGDLLLQGVAGRLSARVGDAGLACRLGGDEFAVLLHATVGAADADALAQAIVDGLSPPYGIEGRLVSVGVSVGIASAPGDGDRPADLMKAADAALYRAKAEGRGRWRRFEATMAERERERTTMAFDLRYALARGELALHYQPIVDLRTGAIEGREALMRWTSPAHGDVPPSEFIPLAEETGVMVEIGDWSLAKACADAAAWPCGGPVAVNLSPVHFRSSGLVETIERALRESGLAPGRLQIEVTEAVLLRDGEGAIATLRRLKAIGVTVSMDDFGTGYSSLGYLRVLPFDRIKVDGTFVRDVATSPEALAIVRAVGRLGATLGLPLVAEGVETQEQAECLRREGYAQAQGFLLGRPLPGPGVSVASPVALHAAA